MKLSLLAVISFLLGVQSVAAHEGHDHGDEKKAAPTVATAPRFAARTDVFELVGVLSGDTLFVYLDRASSNAPVDQAEIELESGAFKAKAERSAPATYRFKAGPLATAGKHALTFSVSAGDDSDLLTVTFDHAPAPAATAAGGDARAAWPWYAAVLALIALAAGFAVWTRWRRR